MSFSNMISSFNRNKLKKTQSPPTASVVQFKDITIRHQVNFSESTGCPKFVPETKFLNVAQNYNTCQCGNSMSEHFSASVRDEDIQAALDHSGEANIIYEHPSSGAKLFLGGYEAATPEYCSRNQIQAIVNTAKGLESLFPKWAQQLQDLKQNSEMSILFLNLLDDHSQRLDGAIQEAVPFLHQHLQKGKSCLVHCARGISRSTSILIAYLMVATEKGFESLLSEIKMKRVQAWPNMNFAVQLREFGTSELRRKLKSEFID